MQLARRCHAKGSTTAPTVFGWWRESVLWCVIGIVWWGQQSVVRRWIIIRWRRQLAGWRTIRYHSALEVGRGRSVIAGVTARDVTGGACVVATGVTRLSWFVCFGITSAVKTEPRIQYVSSLLFHDSLRVKVYACHLELTETFSNSWTWRKRKLIWNSFSRLSFRGN